MAQQSRNLRKRESSGSYYNQEEDENPQKSLDEYINKKGGENGDNKK